MKFVLVDDDSRRKGVATRLVEGCQERWPGAELTPAISQSGVALCRKFTPEATAAGVFSEGLIARQLAAGLTREELDKLAREHDAAMTAGPGRRAPSRPAGKGRRRT